MDNNNVTDNLSAASMMILKRLVASGWRSPLSNGMDTGIEVARGLYTLADVESAVSAYCRITESDEDCDEALDFLDDVREYMEK